jgi:hypothetical protein
MDSLARWPTTLFALERHPLDVRLAVRGTLGLMVPLLLGQALGWPSFDVIAFPAFLLAFGDSVADGGRLRRLALPPQSEAQRSLGTEALRITTDLGRTRSLLSAQAGSSIPRPFLVILVFWITVIFVSFGLFAPANTTVVATLFVCALPVVVDFLGDGLFAVFGAPEALGSCFGSHRDAAQAEPVPHHVDLRDRGPRRRALRPR